MAEKFQAEILSAAVTGQCALDLDVTVHESIDSTNSWCMQQSKAGKELPFACFAEQQTQGRGRRGKDWLMPAFSNIAMSLAWPFVLTCQPIHLLPISIAMTIVETLEDIGLKDVQIKWPNDVYVQGKKIAGILIETQALKTDMKSKTKSEKQVAVIIGVGLNQNMSALDEKIRQTLILTDVNSEVESQSLAVLPERNSVASILLQKMVDVCQNYQRISEHHFEQFRVSYDYCKDKNIEIVLDNNAVLSGIAQGVNENAELLVLIDGQQHIFNSAEVSVKA